jgi:tetratricopeptide (TPR) repeat protein
VNANQFISQGKFEQGAALAAESLELYRRRGDQLGISDALGTLGQIALLRAELQQASELLQEAAAIQTAVSGSVWLAECRSALGSVVLYGGDADKARLWLTECLALCIAQEQHAFAARVCAGLADVALHEGKLDDAEQWLARSLAYPSRQSGSVQDVEFLLIGGRLAAQQQRYTQAAVCFGAAEAISNRMDYHYDGPMRPLVDRAVAQMREEMLSDEFERGWLHGRNLALAPQTTLADLWRIQ